MLSYTVGLIQRVHIPAITWNSKESVILGSCLHVCAVLTEGIYAHLISEDNSQSPSRERRNTSKTACSFCFTRVRSVFCIVICWCRALPQPAVLVFIGKWRFSLNSTSQRPKMLSHSHSFSPLIIMLVIFSQREVCRSAPVSNKSCMTDWLADAGIPRAQVGLYEAKLREGIVLISSIRHFSRFVLRVLGITSEEHQSLILDCARKQCSRPCRNGEVCSITGGAYRCRCRSRVPGDLCDHKINPCHPNPCVHEGWQSGTCGGNASWFGCICFPGYEGKRCHRMIDKCNSNPCLNGGNCTRRFNDFQCSCGPHHHGKVCEHEWISRIDYERLKTGIAQTNKNLANFKSFMHLLFAGWKRRFSCIYQVFKERKTWQQAEKSCASFGGHLTSIHSREEEQFIINHVVKQTSSYLWIGGSDEAVEGAWKWTDGSPVDFFNWATSEPNGAYGENCLELLKHPDPSRKPPSWWNDYPCSLTTHRLDAYLCKVCLKV